MKHKRKPTPYRRHVSKFDLSNVGRLPAGPLAKIGRDEPLTDADEAELDQAMQERMAELRAARIEQKRAEPACRCRWDENE